MGRSWSTWNRTSTTVLRQHSNKLHSCQAEVKSSYFMHSVRNRLVLQFILYYSLLYINTRQKYHCQCLDSFSAWWGTTGCCISHNQSIRHSNCVHDVMLLPKVVTVTVNRCDSGAQEPQGKLYGIYFKAYLISTNFLSCLYKKTRHLWVSPYVSSIFSV